MAGPSRFRAALLGFGILALIILANTWAFRTLGHTNYFIWFLRNGSTAALAASFVGLIWEGVALREDLLSANPLQYLRGCAGLLSTLFFAMSVHLSSPAQGTSSRGPGFRSSVDIWFDAVVSLLLLLVIGLVVIAWLLVIAPLNYFITLISGTLAREELRGQLQRAVVVPTGAGIELVAQPRESELPENALDVSLARKPFAVTQAITSLVLWLMALALPAQH